MHSAAEDSKSKVSISLTVIVLTAVPLEVVMVCGLLKRILCPLMAVGIVIVSKQISLFLSFSPPHIAEQVNEREKPSNGLPQSVSRGRYVFVGPTL